MKCCRLSVCLTEQLAELFVTLLGLQFPFSGEGHDCGGGWLEASRDAEASGGKSEVLSVRPSLVYILTSPWPPPSSPCGDSRGQLRLVMMSTIGYEGGGHNLNKRPFMGIPSSE